ncbi:MAG: serine hydroxymethyltransferase [Chloroflexi bacterium]|nr:serine hydroxymethyltransferase [Chloroflexota bacterium]|tara:strand:+ start:19168 stop:20382 length:1215 start_codon:yes stop_codon:yes gene_type:complete
MKKDLEVEEIIDKENIRQRDSAIFIASENYASEAVRNYTGSILTNKYAEGYPGKRYYAGCENVDIAENLAINRGKELFECDHMNVQPHSGSQANMAVYMSLLKTGDRILSLSLDHGGHLSHGHNVNFSGKLFDIQNYYLNQDTEIIDYEQLENVARKVQPKIIICGYSAYSRTIDFQKFKQIAKETNSLLMADIAHIAGLVASKLHPSPVGIADIITSTTHKTLRGPRGGIAMISKELSRKYDRGIFPMIQGGPIMNTILAKAVAFKEALSNDFKNYSANIISNSKLLAKVFQEGGLRIVSGGTDNHLMLLDLRNIKINGSEAEEKLNSVGIIVNKNAIPFDPLPPNITSGIRVGTPAITTRRINEEDLSTIGDLIVQTLKTPTKKSSVIKSKVTRIMQKLPLP